MRGKSVISQAPSKETVEEQKPRGEGEEDIISTLIGDIGRWQIQMLVLLSLFNIPCTWHIVAMTFQAIDVDYWCAPPPKFESLPTALWRNKTHVPSGSNNGKNDPCRVWDVDYEEMTVERLVQSNFAKSNVSTRECTEWRYQEAKPHETVVSQWNLVCSRKMLKEAAETSFLSGVVVGGLVSGLVSDRLGRKKTLMVSLVLQLILGVIIAFVPVLEILLVLRALLGFVSVGIVFGGFVLSVELVGGKWRGIAGVSYLIPIPISYVLIGAIAYFIRPWKDIQLAITLPGALLLGLWWILPESPRWLLAVDKTEEIVQILKEAARVNKKPLPSNVDKLLEQRTHQNDAGNASILDLCRNPRLRFISLVMYVVWFTDYFIYYGLMMNLSNLGGNIYINTIVSGAVELPSLLLSIYPVVKMGRRWLLAVTFIVSGAACLMALIFVSLGEWVTISFAMIGKFVISCSNAIMPVYTAELFPTVVRNLGVGASNVSAGIALVLAPFIWNLADIDDRLPMGVLGAIGIIGGLSVLLLEETANRPLKNSLEE